LRKSEFFGLKEGIVFGYNGVMTFLTLLGDTLTTVYIHMLANRVGCSGLPITL